MPILLLYITVDLDEAVQYGGARVPSMLSYKNLADTNSMFKCA